LPYRNRRELKPIWSVCTNDHKIDRSPESIIRDLGVVNWLVEPVHQQKASDNRITASIKEIFAWCQILTAEGRAKDHPYLWPEPVKRLLSSLELSSRGLYTLTGWLGVGKSQGLIAIKDELSSKKILTMYIKIEGRRGLTKSILRQHHAKIRKYEKINALKELEDLNHVTERSSGHNLGQLRASLEITSVTVGLLGDLLGEKNPSVADLDRAYKFLSKDTVRNIK